MLAKRNSSLNKNNEILKEQNDSIGNKRRNQFKELDHSKRINNNSYYLESDFVDKEENRNVLPLNNSFFEQSNNLFKRNLMFKNNSQLDSHYNSQMIRKDGLNTLLPPINEKISILLNPENILKLEKCMIKGNLKLIKSYINLAARKMKIPQNRAFLHFENLIKNNKKEKRDSNKRLAEIVKKVKKRIKKIEKKVKKKRILKN